MSIQEWIQILNNNNFKNFQIFKDETKFYAPTNSLFRSETDGPLLLLLLSFIQVYKKLKFLISNFKMQLLEYSNKGSQL